MNWKGPELGSGGETAIDLQRDYTTFDRFVAQLTQDIYAQPPDRGHVAWAFDVIKTLCAAPEAAESVLDIGCGQGIAEPFFRSMGKKWTGVTIGEDYRVCLNKGLDVHQNDMTFLPFGDGQFDMVFARHALEHSPFPLITLMEWGRVCSGWLVLVAPAPEYWTVRGRNHYAMLYKNQLDWLLERAGWQPIYEQTFKMDDPLFSAYEKPNKYLDEQAEDPKCPAPTPVEYRYLCAKVPEVIE